ncbi:MAG: hypothetical protein J3K34DRAFT_518959 [Monoraphidium minutum]|nr:MAG: hypothetical protein J3K34DRAFT_518959 [Monoraphidium minutum]
MRQRWAPIAALMVLLVASQMLEASARPLARGRGGAGAVARIATSSGGGATTYSSGVRGGGGGYAAGGVAVLGGGSASVGVRIGDSKFYAGCDGPCKAGLSSAGAAGGAAKARRGGELDAQDLVRRFLDGAAP